MARMTKLEIYAAIRRDCRAGLGVRALARKYGVHRRTVREALTSVWPKPRKKLPPRRSRLDPFKPAIDQMLWADLDAPAKQRHTVKRIFDRLVAERVLTDREETASVAIASNDSFGGWTNTFTDPRLSAAIVDRLTFNATIIETGTDSYRLAKTRAQQGAAQPEQVSEVPRSFRTVPPIRWGRPEG